MTFEDSGVLSVHGTYNDHILPVPMDGTGLETGRLPPACATLLGVCLWSCNALHSGLWSIRARARCLKLAFKVRKPRPLETGVA